MQAGPCGHGGFGQKMIHNSWASQGDVVRWSAVVRRTLFRAQQGRSQVSSHGMMVPNGACVVHLEMYVSSFARRRRRQLFGHAGRFPSFWDHKSKQ